MVGRAATLCMMLLMWTSMVSDDELPEQDTRFGRPYGKDSPHDFRPLFEIREAWEARAGRLRRQALVAQGLWPMPPRVPLEPVVHGKVERDGYTVEKVFFRSLPGHYVSGNLYRPTGEADGKRPGVLAPYGHWPKGRFIWLSDTSVEKELKSGAERDPVAARAPLQASCATLARMGCVVLHYDMVGYGDSTWIEHAKGFTDAEAVLRLQSFMGLQTWNSARAMDFLVGLPDVDPSRVAVTGSSSGGTQTIALNAVDDRATAAVPMVMVSMNMQGGCVCENAPLYRVGTNNVELASLPAPKPQGVVGANDWTHDFLRRGLPEMKSIWGLYEAADRIAGVHVDYGHNHNLHSRLAQYAFLNDFLKLGQKGPIDERPFEAIPPAGLSVYDEGHPAPADAADAKALRQWMTRTSDEQLAAMSGDAYAEVVRTALEAMVVDAMPSPDDVVAAFDAGGSDASARNGWLGRRGAGERVPFSLRVPDLFHGTVVVWAHPEGRQGVEGEAEAVRALLDSGRAVLTVEPFLSNGFSPTAAPTTAPAGTYAGMTLGYNRSILANRVHDLLSAVAMARGMEGVRAVELIGTGKAGTTALLARALAGDAVGRTAIDLDRFDFDHVQDDADDMMLPGGLKYGGVWGFVPLCEGRRTLLTNGPTVGPRQAMRLPVAGVTVEPGRRDVRGLVAWLVAEE